MKPADTLTTLLSHHLWANLRLLEQCAALTDEQLAATCAGAFGSLREILQHIVTAEQSYFSPISTGQIFGRPEDAPPMTIVEMMVTACVTGAGFIEYQAAIDTYARRLRERFQAMLESVEGTRARLETVVEVATPALSVDGDEPTAVGEAAEPDDVLAKIEAAAIEALRRNQRIMGWIHGEMGGWWWAVQSFLRDLLPEELDNRLKARIVQDADRLDAIGAIGIARCLMLGGALGKPLYNVEEPLPQVRAPDESQYVVDHFYQKLLLLAERMQTATGRQEAERRTAFMRDFLAQLSIEVADQ
jgi:hypothetical protein